MSRHRHKDSGSGKKASLALPVVDVVIPYHGPAEFMRKCLAAIPAAAGNVAFNVVVVDDFFEDGQEIQKIVSDIPWHITLVRNKQNMGFGATCNRGARVCGARYVLFLNSDVELLPNSISSMIDAMNQDPTISVVGPKLLFPEGSPYGPAETVQHAGMEINIRGEPFHIFIGWSRNHPKVNKPRTVPAVTGAAFMTRRDDFNSVDGFDPLWGLGTAEDVDYCMKQVSRGKHILYLPVAEGYHFVGGSQTRYPLQQNLMIFKARWGGYLRWTDWELW